MSRVYRPPYTHISCSGYSVHLKINKNFALDIQYIFTQYQKLNFCILLFLGVPFHIVTFHVPKNSVHVNNSQSQKPLKYYVSGQRLIALHCSSYTDT